MFQKKRGLLGSYASSKGFLVSKRMVHGEPRWSAPLFVEERLVGFGLTLGYANKGVCLAMTEEASVKVAAKKRRTFGVTWNFLLDMNGAYVRKVCARCTDCTLPSGEC